MRVRADAGDDTRRTQRDVILSGAAAPALLLHLTLAVPEGSMAWVRAKRGRIARTSS